MVGKAGWEVDDRMERSGRQVGRSMRQVGEVGMTGRQMGMSGRQVVSGMQVGEGGRVGSGRLPVTLHPWSEAEEDERCSSHFLPELGHHWEPSYSGQLFHLFLSFF